MARKKGFVVDDDVESGDDDNISRVDVEEDDALAIGFSVSGFQLLREYDNEDDDNDDEDQDEASEHDQVTHAKTSETSSKNTKKKKKKKNRGAKPGQEEEEDIDRILAEIGGAPSVSQPAKVADLEGPAESVTSKKKRKKKGKENEETGKQDETKTDVESTVPDKKVSRAVRGIQDKLAKIKEAEERKRREKEERLRKQEEERLRLQELERQEEERKRLKKERRKENIIQKKKEGTYLTPKQKEGQKKMEAIRNQIMANAAGGELLGESFRPATKWPQYQKKKSKPQAQSNVAGPVQVEEEPTTKVAVTDGNEVPASLDSEVCSGAPVESGKDLRSPICCIMGHVDTGKTKLLDRIRGTDVQGGEAGGITQQIGATYFPAKNIRDRTKELKADAMLNVPGLLVIDTPGHASFTNLRSRGSGLCDIAILVVDIMHGLEPQTIESLNLLRMRDTQFIVALNKVDRLYGWITRKNAPIMKAMKQQSKNVRNEFNRRLTEIITQFKMQGLNTELYYRNQEMGETYSIVPTSAISGEGIPDLLLLLAQWTQKTMIERLTFSNKVQCTVLEVKVMEGHGTSIDVVLVNGVLHEGDQIVVCGMQGAIVTSIRALLTPHPMKELRVKGTYLHHKEIKAAQGIKITAQGLEHAIAGTSLYVVGPDDDIEDIKDIAMEDMKSVMSRIDKSGAGVYVQTSTIGSLEALLEFLKSPAVSIPVSGISIGPVHKKDVMKASVMLEKKKEYGTILAFDVKVTQDARKLAKELGVNIFCADIIYHLFDQFKGYTDKLKEEGKKESADEAVFPCVLKIMPNHVFNTKAPIVLGVTVLEGTAKIGTPICVPQRQFIEIGRIASIENNHKQVAFAKKGQKVAIKITARNSEQQQKMFGQHFDMEDELVSKISRNSLDALKRHHANEITKGEKALLFKLRKLFKIP